MTMLETSTFLHSVQSPGQVPNIEHVLMTLDQDLRHNAQQGGLSNISLTSEPSKHWMKIEFVHGGALYDWALGIQFHRAPDVSGTRIDSTVRYVHTSDPLAQDNLTEVLDILRAAMRQSLDAG